MTTKKSWKNLSLARILLIACSSALLSGSAYAIADGRSGCWQNEIRYTAMHGSEDQLVAAIDKIANDWFDQVQKASTRPIFGIQVGDKKPTKPSIERLRLIFTNLWEGCDGKLIDYTVAAGNVLNTNRLLSLGADPAGRSIADDADTVLAAILDEANSSSTSFQLRFLPHSNIFRRCISAEEGGYLSGSRRYHNNEYLEIDQSARIALFEMLIKQTDASEIIAPDGQLNSALTSCNDPQVLKILIKNTAGLGMQCFDSTNTGTCLSALDKRLIDYIRESHDEKRRLRRLELLKSVAKSHPTKTLAKTTEITLCHACQRLSTDSSICSDLNALINVRHPATLLPQPAYKPNVDSNAEVNLCHEFIR